MLVLQCKSFQHPHYKRQRTVDEEQWKSSTSSKRQDRSENEDDESGRGEKRRKGGKRRKKDKGSKSRYDTRDEDTDMMDDWEDLEDEDANMGYREPIHTNDRDDEAGEMLRIALQLLCLKIRMQRMIRSMEVSIVRI